MQNYGRGLESFFSPRSIAVVGASDRPGAVGGAVLANLRSAKFAGLVFAVNPQHPTVQGQPAYPSIQALPQVPELAVLCTSAETVPDVVTECGRSGVQAVVVISAGFREIGPAGRLLEANLKARLREFPSMRMIGPNCLGLVRPAHGLNASFSPVTPRPGRMTLLTQSGALGTAIMDWSMERDIGFATCVSVGNMLDVGMAELIHHFADDDQTEALLLYIEGVADGHRFVSAARACSRKKPVIAYKSGCFEASSKAAASHTGAMASSDAVYDAAFRRAGIERVRSIEELFDCARLLSGQRHAFGNRLAIVTNAGGPGVMASDAWLAHGGRLAELSQEGLNQLNTALPPCWSHGNPIDVLGDASYERFQAAIRIALADPQVDAVMVIVTPQTMTQADKIAEAVVVAQQQSDKTVVASWIGGQAVEAGRLVLRAAQIPVYDFPEEAALALHHLVNAGQRLSPPTRIEVKDDFDAPTSVSQLTPDRLAYWKTHLSNNPGLIDEVDSKLLLAEGGIPIVPTKVAHSMDEAELLADQLGYPAVLKVRSPDISHKTDVGGVMLNLANADRVRAAYATIYDSVQQKMPEARWEGVTVQPMISPSRGVELLLGMKHDPQFGPVILLGAGGITAELQKDSVLELLPIDDEAWEHMLRKLRLTPLLHGYRGRPGVNVSALKQAVLRFAQLVDDLPELEAAEMNPILVTAEKALALDARVISHGKRDAV